MNKEAIEKRIGELQISLNSHIQAANFHTGQVSKHQGAIEELQRLLADGPNGAETPVNIEDIVKN